MAWPRSVAGVARLLGRDQVSDPHGCVLEFRGRLIRTIAWPRSVAGAARLLGRDQVLALHGCLFECSSREADLHGCVAEIRRLIRTVACSSFEGD